MTWTNVSMIVKSNFINCPKENVPLYQDVEPVQWDEWVTHRSVKIHSPAEAAKFRQQVPRSHSRFAYRKKKTGVLDPAGYPLPVKAKARLVIRFGENRCTGQQSAYLCGLQHFLENHLECSAICLCDSSLPGRLCRSDLRFNGVQLQRIQGNVVQIFTGWIKNHLFRITCPTLPTFSVCLPQIQCSRSRQERYDHLKTRYRDTQCSDISQIL